MQESREKTLSRSESHLLVAVLALIIWILATTHEARTLPCASEEFNENQIGNIWDYCVLLLVLCGPLQALVAGLVAQASSGKLTGKWIAVSHLVSALVQARLLLRFNPCV